MQSPKRSFGPLDIIAIAFNICQAWAAIGAALTLSVTHGGAPALIYGLILVTVVYFVIALSAAELATIYPTAGGQYHWTAMLAPRRMRNQFSYACGCINMIGWIILVASAILIPAQIVCGIIKFYEPSYEIQRWHVFLVYQGINLIVFAYNAFALQKASWTHNIGFALSIGTFFAAIVACLVLAKPKQPSASVWTSFKDQTGLDSIGLAFMTGLVNINFGFAGLDGAIHLAEESIDPTRTVPSALLSAVLMNFVTTFSFLVATFYCVADWSKVANTPTQIPLYEMWYQGTGSKTAATTLISAVALMLLFTSIAVLQTSSRLTWSLARDDALLGATHLKRMHPKLGVPLWALLFNAAWVLVLGIVYLGSSTAFNAIVGPAIILEQATFAIPALMLLCRRRDPQLLSGSKGLRLGKFGWIANLVTIAWALIELVFYSLPVQLPATSDNMNYTSAVLAAVLVFILLNWVFHGKHHYKGPNIRVNADGEVSYMSSGDTSSPSPEEPSVVKGATGKES